MSYFSNPGQNQSTTLEWAYMIAGVIVVVLSTTLIFGTSLEVNQSMNIVMAVALIGFAIYSSSSAKKLRNSIYMRENQAHQLQTELQKAADELGNLRFEIKEKRMQIDTLRKELAEYHDKTETLEQVIEDLRAQIIQGESEKG